MDQNPNNNPPGSDPNANPVGSSDANPVATSPQDNIPGSFSSPASSTFNPSDLGGTPTPSPADPVSPPADPFPSPSNLTPAPELPIQPDPMASLSPAPTFSSGLDLSSSIPGSPSPSTSSSGAPAWAAPQPAPADPLPSDPSVSGFGATDPGSMGSQPGFDQPPPSPAEEPVPTFMPSAPVGDSPVAAPEPAWPGAVGGTSDISAGLPAADVAEPSVPQFPPTWPPAPSTTGSFDMGGATSPEPQQFGTSTPGDGGSGEAGPTDLSHLMGSSAGGEITSPQPVPVATTLMSPQPSGSEAPATSPPADANAGASQVVTSSPSGGFPKWMLLVGAVVLLVAVAASAYFILGVGSSGQEQTSLPAEQAPLTNPPRAIVPSPAVQPPPPSTSSASFGNLQGSAPQPSTSSGQSGASALELLRQRQGR